MYFTIVPTSLHSVSPSILYKNRTIPTFAICNHYFPLHSSILHLLLRSASTYRETMIESIASWFTPTVLFCFLNLIIGTIFFTSTLKTDKKTRLQRVKSFNFTFPDPFSSTTHHFSNNLTQLEHTPSLLQRIKSINLSFCSRPNPIPQYNEDQVDDIEPHIANKKEEDKSVTCQAAKLMTRTILVKSASEKKMPVAEVDLHRPATTRERVMSSFEEDEAVDKKADDFINKFRQQLKLQRLHSILRYKEMLNRGVPRWPIKLIWDKHTLGLYPSVWKLHGYFCPFRPLLYICLRWKRYYWTFLWGVGIWTIHMDILRKCEAWNNDIELCIRFLEN